MSYCRFSSDNFKSDVYCYESCYGGFTIHIAGSKKKFRPIPDFPFHKLNRLGGKIKDGEVVYPTVKHKIIAMVVLRIAMYWHKLHNWSVRVIPNVPLNLTHDGETMSTETAWECAKSLLLLREIGYHVPQFAIDALIEECKENDTRTENL